MEKIGQFGRSNSMKWTKNNEFEKKIEVQKLDAMHARAFLKKNRQRTRIDEAHLGAIRL